METIQHFSHSEHLLILKKLGEKEVEFVCYGCHEPIREKENYYACEEGRRECPSFYLHKKCADLPRVINLPLTHKHPLTLFASPPFYKPSACGCNICGRSDWKWFTYDCSLCEFHIDVICSSMRQELNNSVEHEAHLHPLGFNRRPSVFHCDACDTKQEDLSYFCNTCQFCIHKSCASTPKSITVAHHNDPLLLAYSLPPEYRTFDQICNICREKVHPSYWVYYCGSCRYLTHLKCAFAKTARARKREIQAKEGDTDLSNQLMKFPLPNHQSLDPSSLVVSGAYYDNWIERVTSHGHNIHLLTTHNDPHITTSNLKPFNELVCDGCIRPLSVPFCSCIECSFFLHRSCAELQKELVCCPNDPKHSLGLGTYGKLYDYFQCFVCLKSSNGFLYTCESCELTLDVGCANNSIPSTIIHESHEHPLVKSSSRECDACADMTSVSHTYGCKVCRFDLCIKCVNYPESVTHEYDKHPIPLTYPPIKDHPSDFICEICEKDINPRYWMYHCQHCNQSFHADCLSPYDWYSNVKFGGTVDLDDILEHPLYFVRNSRSEKRSSLCNQCGQNNNGVPILECARAPCVFILCLACANKI